MYRVTTIPKPPLGIPIGNEKNNTRRSEIRTLYNMCMYGYHCAQLNGQRSWKRWKDFDGMNEPSLECEIFIGKIPYHVCEDELIPLLSQVCFV